MRNDRCLAVLIDAENIPYKKVNEIMEEVATYGIPTIKRIYGDWTENSVKGWKKILLENAITPIQQYSYTHGKNSTDSAMIIDAMDILYSGKVEGFCIVSSDSDFTRLAIRLREAGIIVYGIGEQKTPTPFIAACNKFTYIEVLNTQANEENAVDTKVPKEETIQKTQKSQASAINSEIINLIATSISDVANDDGWAFLAEVGKLIIKKKPDFDPRNFGFIKLTPLIKTLTQFEIDERESGNSKIKHVYVKNKHK